MPNKEHIWDDFEIINPFKNKKILFIGISDPDNYFLEKMKDIGINFLPKNPTSRN